MEEDSTKQESSRTSKNARVGVPCARCREQTTKGRLDDSHEINATFQPAGFDSHGRDARGDLPLRGLRHRLHPYRLSSARGRALDDPVN